MSSCKSVAWSVVLLAAIAGAGACGESRRDRDAAAASEASAERFTARGRIVGISGKQIEIHHERIPAIRSFDGRMTAMESMTMSFARLSNTRSNGAALEVGTAVDFEFTVHYDADPTLRLTRIERLPPGTPLELK